MYVDSVISNVFNFNKHFFLFLFLLYVDGIWYVDSILYVVYYESNFSMGELMKVISLIFNQQETFFFFFCVTTYTVLGYFVSTLQPVLSVMH